MITPCTWKVFVVIVAYQHGMHLDRDVPARYDTITPRTATVLCLIMSYQESTRRDFDVPPEYAALNMVTIPTTCVLRVFFGQNTNKARWTP